MSAVTPPYPLFSDRDGSPLDAGYIWIGVANANAITNPIAAFWDSALTQPATQPIRTSGGYPVNAGTPSRLYVAGQYSILVQDAKGSLVYSASASDGGSAAASVESFSGNGVATSFVLANAPDDAESMIVRISGAVQTPGVDFTLTGSTLAFTSAPPSGSGNIVAQSLQASRSGAFVGASFVQYPDLTTLDQYIGPVGSAAVVQVVPGGSAFKIPSGAGSSGQVLSTDGAGNLSWAGSATSTIASKNRFANGAYRFDQLNDGNLVTINSPTVVRCLDCTSGGSTAAAGAYTVQAIATGGPVGSQNFLRMAVVVADASPLAATYYAFSAALIEGLDIADLSFGTANAQPISVSFWFRSSLTGTFGARLNNDGTRSYVVSWSYPTANVWQRVTLPNIPGDVTGTWLTGNVRALTFDIDIGSGTNWKVAAGAWTAGNFLGVTGGTNLISTVSATMDIALMQIEQGESCTPFEWTSYQANLARVQRYLLVYRAPSFALRVSGQATGTTTAYFPITLPVPTRENITGATVTTPTSIFVRSSTGSAVSITGVAFGPLSATTTHASLSVTGASGLTAGDATVLAQSGSSVVVFTGAEL
jgi:hypothetical protein